MAANNAESLTDRDKRLESVATKLRNKLTAEELEALYRHVPKKTFVAWTGLPDKSIDSIGARYGWPVKRGATVAPPDILASVFEWVKTNSREINKAITAKGFEAEIGLDDGQGADWQDKCYEEKFYSLRDQRLQREGDMLPREVVRAFHGEWSEILRQLFEQFDKREKLTGAEAHDLLHGAVIQIEELIGEIFSEDDEKQLSELEA